MGGGSQGWQTDRTLQAPLVTRDDYLDLKISKLRHRIADLPRRRDIFVLATDILDSIAPFRLDHITLRRARDMAFQERSFLSSDLVASIITLCDLIKEASSVPAAVKWIAATLAEAVEAKTARTGSLLSDRSVDRA